jgi:hypothetical protein
MRVERILQKIQKITVASIASGKAGLSLETTG